MPQSYDLITISREFGAGGSELAAALGTRLGWRVLDHEIATTVAARLGVDADDIEARDEHAPGLLERIGTTILRTAPEVLVVPPSASAPGPEAIAAAVRTVLVETAKSPPVIVVGHGAQSLLGDRPGTLHLRLVAPLACRVARIQARTGCSLKEAVGTARRVDADRVSYVRQYYGKDLHDPLLYDLLINTGALPLDEIASMVAALVEREGDRG